MFPTLAKRFHSASQSQPGSNHGNSIPEFIPATTQLPPHLSMPSFQHNPSHGSSEVSPTVISGTYSQENASRIEALLVSSSLFCCCFEITQDNSVEQRNWGKWKKGAASSILLVWLLSAAP